MNIQIIEAIIKEVFMDTIFYSLQEFMTYSKGITYLIMGAILILMPLYWLFLTDRDEQKETY